jgi:hypothetical protein
LKVLSEQIEEKKRQKKIENENNQKYVQMIMDKDQKDIK